MKQEKNYVLPRMLSEDFASITVIGKHEPPQGFVIYMAAVGFFRSATILLNEIEARIETVPREMYHLGVPMAVQFAFCAESFLKAFLAEGSGFDREHNLVVLYDQLDDGMKELIAKQYSLFDSQAVVTAEEIRVIYDRHKNAFIMWRYIWDHDDAQVNLAELYMLCFAMCQAYLEYKGPHFASQFEEYL